MKRLTKQSQRRDCRVATLLAMTWRLTRRRKRSKIRPNMIQEIPVDHKASFGAMLDPERSAAMSTLLTYVADEKNPADSRGAVLNLLTNLDKLGDKGVAILKDLNTAALVNEELTSKSIANVLMQHFQE